MSDGISDVCSDNLGGTLTDNGLAIGTLPSPDFYVQTSVDKQVNPVNTAGLQFRYWDGTGTKNDGVIDGGNGLWQRSIGNDNWVDDGNLPNAQFARSEEHTSELQSLMRISYAVFCLKKKKHR